MALSKRAKILTEKQEASVLHALDTNGRYTLRNRVMFLLSVKAGLRAKEIALLTWSMVTDAEGQIADAISIENKASKGKRGGRTIPMNQQLKKAVEGLQAETATPPIPECPVIRSERGRQAAAGGAMSPASIADWFGDLYREMGFDGCSSHSGRRTFITRAARKISAVGGSLRDVQFLAGHATLATTQIYIDGESDAQRKIVDLI
jgi:integrase